METCSPAVEITEAPAAIVEITSATLRVVEVLHPGGRGPVGPAPEIEFVDVVTLAPGEPATIEVAPGSTPENPKFVLSVPQGQPGIGLPVSVDSPTVGDTLIFNGSAWANRPSTEIVDGGNF